jgi:hypothetical protein
MKFNKKYLIPCVLLVAVGGLAARAQQAQQTGLTREQELNKLNDFLLQNMMDTIKRDPNVMNRPVVLTIAVGSRSDRYEFDQSQQVFNRISDASSSDMRISAAVPIMNMCAIPFKFKGSHPDIVSEFRLNNGGLEDVLTIPDRGTETIGWTVDEHHNFVIPAGMESGIESLQKETIKAGLKDSVDNFNNTLANIGYKIDLDSAQIEDSRDPYYQAQNTPTDPNDKCSKIVEEVSREVKMKKNTDSSISPFGSITHDGLGIGTLNVTYNAYTITISITPTKI